MLCATVLYPSKEGRSFDFEQYASTLAPMCARFLGVNCTPLRPERGS